MGWSGNAVVSSVRAFPIIGIYVVESRSTFNTNLG